MAGSIDAEITDEAAVPPATSRMSPVRLAGGGLSLGRTVGARDHHAFQRGSETGSGFELAGNGPSVWIELEERSDHREAGGGVWLAPSSASAGACHWH